MIQLDGVRARGLPQKGEATPELRGASVKLEAGVTVLVGTRAGGGPLVLDLIHGRVRPRGGVVTVLSAVAGSSAVQKDVAYVPLAAELPRGLTVKECVRIAFNSRAKGPRDAGATLERLGVAALAERKTATLTQGEQRAVLLSIALACGPKVLLMEEPCTWFDARALAMTTEALRALASEGNAVIVTTQSRLDAKRLGGRHLAVEAGLIGPLAARDEKGALLVICDRAKELAAALATLPSVAKLRVTGSRVLLSGKNAKDVTRDVGAVIARDGFDVAAFERVEEAV